jgi:hypothetical protein
MSQHVYWSAPLWQVAVVAVACLVALAWLARRALRRPEPAEALAALDPALAREPLFFFDGSRGLTPLNDAALRLLAGQRDGSDRRGPVVETLLEAYEGATTARREGWPAPGRSLVAHPLSDGGTVVTGVLGLVTTDTLLPPGDAPDGLLEDATPRSWVSLGPSLRLHRSRPAVHVRCVVAETPDGEPVWREEPLSPTEEALLRHLLDHRDEPQSGAALFAVAWPDDEVDELGLRPDQGDRLRRLVFQLRQRVEPDPASPRYVLTARGVGYALYVDRAPEP